MAAGRNIHYKESGANNATAQLDPMLHKSRQNPVLTDFRKGKEREAALPVGWFHSKLQEVLSMATNAAQQVASGGNLQTFHQQILH